MIFFLSYLFKGIPQWKVEVRILMYLNWLLFCFYC
nr:MAG TPA: hypothetical protein [Bacteriophage sp.]